LALPSDADKRGNWNFFLVFWERSIHNEAVRKVIRLHYEEWLKRVGRLIRRAKDAGQLAADFDIAIAGCGAH